MNSKLVQEMLVQEVITARGKQFLVDYDPPTNKQPIDGWNLYELSADGWTFIKRYGDRNLAVNHAKTGSPWTVYS